MVREPSFTSSSASPGGGRPRDRISGLFFLTNIKGMWTCSSINLLGYVKESTPFKYKLTIPFSSRSTYLP